MQERLELVVVLPVLEQVLVPALYKRNLCRLHPLDGLPEHLGYGVVIEVVPPDPLHLIQPTEVLPPVAVKAFIHLQLLLLIVDELESEIDER